MKILLIGGAGEVGITLYEGLKDRYDIYIMDKTKNSSFPLERFIYCDVLDLGSFQNKFPVGIDVVINLLSHKTVDELKMPHLIDKDIDVFFKPHIISIM